MYQRPNWRCVCYGPHQKIKIAGSKLYARHEPLASSAKATASKALCSLVHGHDHKIAESHLIGMNNDEHVIFSVGWLGNKFHPVYNYVKAHQQWQLGFGLEYVDPKTKYFYHQAIHILNNYTCVVNGKMYKHEKI